METKQLMSTGSRRLLICSPCRAIFGGVESIIADLCRHLPRLGWEVTLGLGEGARFNKIDSYREVFPDLPIVSIDGTKGTRQARVESIRRVVDQLHPDVVLVARLFDVQDVVTHLKDEGAGVRLAITIQTYEAPYLFDAELYRDSIDLCVASGEMIRRAAIEWSGLPAERVTNIPGGVEAPVRPVSPRCGGEALHLGYVGRLESGQKRIFDLAHLVRLLDEKRAPYHLDVVGTGPDEDELRRALTDSARNGRVTFHGWVDREGLYREILPRLDVLVHFSWTEGVTIAPREAMAHGVVPVISEFLGLGAEGHFLDGVNALTFPVGDIEAATVRILRLHREPGLLERLSRAAMDSQTGKYSFEGALCAWSEALDGCLAAPTRRSDRLSVKLPPDGRLQRWGLSPWMAQRVRDLLGRRHAHESPGGEWPTHSGLCTHEATRSLLELAQKVEGIRAA